MTEQPLFVFDVVEKCTRSGTYFIFADNEEEARKLLEKEEFFEAEYGEPDFEERDSYKIVRVREDKYDPKKIEIDFKAARERLDRLLGRDDDTEGEEWKEE